MSTWSCFALISTALVSWSPATLAKMVGNLVKSMGYTRIYLLVLALLATTCLALTPPQNLQPTRGWGGMLLGVPFALGGPLIAAALDARIVRRVNLAAARRVSKTPQTSLYRSGDASARPPVWVAHMKVAKSVQNMPLWQLLVVGAGEEIGFRIGVPILALRATPQWFVLVLLGAALFAYGHSVFGRGQVLSKIPLAVLGTVLFVLWGAWACVLGHLVYNIHYWWLRDRARGSKRVAA